jgi:hypothetical protein
VLRLLLPIAAVAAILFVIGGVIQNLHDPMTITTITGGSQVIQGGPVASQEAIKELGTNGGGFFNANSAHPFENPNGLTNLFQIVLLLAIPSALPYTYGLMVKDRRQGLAIAGAMAFLTFGAMSLLVWLEAAGGSMEGKEQRFGTVWSAIFASATTGTSTGAVNSMHESLQPLSGGVAMLNMMLGELSPGGVGNGSVLDAGDGRPDRVHRRPDGRPDTGAPGQDDRQAGDHAREPLDPHHAHAGPAGHRACPRASRSHVTPCRPTSATGDHGPAASSRPARSSPATATSSRASPRRRVGDHRRVGAGDPRVRRRPLAVTGGTKVLSDRIVVKITPSRARASSTG